MYGLGTSGRLKKVLFLSMSWLDHFALEATAMYTVRSHVGVRIRMGLWLKGRHGINSIDVDLPMDAPLVEGSRSHSSAGAKSKAHESREGKASRPRLPMK